VTSAAFAEIRALLERERQRVSAALAAFHEGSQRTMEEEAGLPGGVGADTASLTFERELDQGLEEGAQQTLKLIDAAIARLDDGTFGVCERCGKPIADERLLARPWATLCIDDQRSAGRA
jgi:RNA polymerase-binding protein DksA